MIFRDSVALKEEMRSRALRVGSSGGLGEGLVAAGDDAIEAKQRCCRVRTLVLCACALLVLLACVVLSFAAGVFENGVGYSRSSSSQIKPAKAPTTKAPTRGALHATASHYWHLQWALRAPTAPHCQPLLALCDRVLTLDPTV